MKNKIINFLKNLSTSFLLGLKIVIVFILIGLGFEALSMPDTFLNIIGLLLLSTIIIYFFKKLRGFCKD
jgi:hypothetical protein